MHKQFANSGGGGVSDTNALKQQCNDVTMRVNLTNETGEIQYDNNANV